MEVQMLSWGGALRHSTTVNMCLIPRVMTWRAV